MAKVRTAALVAGGTALLTLAFANPALAQTTTSSNGVSPTVWLIGAAVMGTACWFVAKSKGRSPVLWAALGFFFGFIPLIIIAVMKKKTPEPTYGMGASALTPPPPPPPPPGQ